MIATLQEAEQALQPFVPLVAQLTGKDTTLERITPLMQVLGNPQDTLRAIHIAGTSGKTSTSYYISSLLVAGGQKVGLTVSPHVDALNERVQINGQPLTVPEFCALLQEFLEIIDTVDQKPSYFELLYAFALWVFSKYNVDYAVVETGLGGLFDATNVMTRPDKVCVITDIGFDHVHILGNTLTEIATQKIGIVHPQNTVLMYEQNPEIMQAIRAWTNAQHATVIVVDQNIQQGDFIASVAPFQKRNWWLAAHVYEFLSNRDGLKHLTRQELLQTQLTYVPGRIDTVQIGTKAVVMDGAHNGQKMTAFIASFTTLFPDVKPTVLVALKQGKDYAEVAPLLASFANKIIVTTFNTSQDLPTISLEPDLLIKALREVEFTNAIAVPDQDRAFQELLDDSSSIVVVTGSFYLLSQLRHTKRYHDQTHRSN